MKKKIVALATVGAILLSAAVVFAEKPDSPPGQESAEICATIKDGTIEYGRVGDTNDEIIPIGYDQWGYNYQAHLFNGLYWNNQRPEPPYTYRYST